MSPLIPLMLCKPGVPVVVTTAAISPLVVKSCVGDAELAVKALLGQFSVGSINSSKRQAHANPKLHGGAIRLEESLVVSTSPSSAIVFVLPLAVLVKVGFAKGALKFKAA
jgi:hypothetical protein